jgi:hypothetical protein
MANSSMMSVFLKESAQDDMWNDLSEKRSLVGMRECAGWRWEARIERTFSMRSPQGLFPLQRNVVFFKGGGLV